MRRKIVLPVEVGIGVHAEVEARIAGLPDGSLDLTGCRVWLGDAEITKYLRTGAELIEVVDNQVVFASTGKPWRPMRNPKVEWFR